MNLITSELLRKFNALGSQENNPDPMVVVKYFYGSCSWLATEFDAESRTFFGYVVGQESEWGYFSLDELESYRSNLGLTIERDLYSGYQCLSQHLKALGIASF